MSASKAYYNEFDTKAAAWLREIIRRGLIADGDVDERSIADVRPDDLAGYVQCHFFAGIGGWSYAMRLAGWPDARPVWTGSCPCQPFSCAGKAGGVGDERHLWPAFLALIAECRPSVVFGEQVASKDGRLWLAGVRADLERAGYAVGGANLCAAGVGAPHIRQRLYWLADSIGARGRLEPERQEEQPIRKDAWISSKNGRLANSALGGLGADGGAPGHAGHSHQRGQGGGVGDAGGSGREGCGRPADMELHSGAETQRSTAKASPWSDSVWIPCRDGKSRRVEPGLAPLAYGVPARVVRLRGYGNAIVPPLAAEFVMAAMEAMEVSDDHQ